MQKLRKSANNMNAKSQSTPTANNIVVDKRLSSRIKIGDIINGTTVDPVLRSYLPFKAKVVNISDSGIQLAIKKGSIRMLEGTKLIIIPPAMKEISASSKEAVVIWCKEQGEYTVCGCMFTSR